MTDKLDCVIVGAGVIGLAIGRALANAGREVVIVEAEPEIGMHTSSRNSEVIHAGIYYPENSLKARLCVRGKELLYRYCADRKLPHERIGKLIVACDEADLDKLRLIDRRARQNNVSDLRFLDAATVRNLEPSVECVGGLLSPSTGIIDSHSYMLALQADLELRHGTVVINSRAEQITANDSSFKLIVDGAPVTCKSVVNSAGLNAVDLAKSIGFTDGTTRLPFEIPDQYYAKGHWFTYQGASPFRHLIYPTPGGGGLGIHATHDLTGALKFGPDVMWVNEIDYSFDETRKGAFMTAIKRYFPSLDPGRLVPGYTGIRAKIVPYGKPDGDFLIHGQAMHGIPNLVCLYGIESPGLTASLAIADYVVELLAASQ